MSTEGHQRWFSPDTVSFPKKKIWGASEEEDRASRAGRAFPNTGPQQRIQRVFPMQPFWLMGYSGIQDPAVAETQPIANKAVPVLINASVETKQE